MALKIKAAHPSYPDGTEIAFGDFFLAKVGEDVLVDDETLERYKQATGKELADSVPKTWNTAQASKAAVEAAKVEEPTNEVEGGEKA